ncbi:LPS export ABC transporter ATP-binding protein [Acetobacter sp. TBRC 12305]|uniref:Lipopolysaccharide export system ATP-binding protein LptB n=1 Tax=Acetobacter garciniae TaxID=2817435 RepID=A0A939KQR2_9PROT|nr:LPS export ABC transporter ATP-binding protein [Acetobacter garciniae]MBO1325794.1 LPS export ABC transporter ATP-binding protein [Acetobacter garciniae]MBX0345694.1 LPS export ABC transporter ATP-binding protein [Acetobacter garciniae]
MLTARNLVKSFDGMRIVENISLHVGEGEIVGLLGPNGAGKSTTFKMLTGIMAPDSGQIFLNGIDATSMPFHHRARHGLAYLPQGSFLPRSLSVADALGMVLETRMAGRSERQRHIASLLADFELTDVCHNRIGTLSGGQRRRCEIAVCVACAPVIALFDEPFAGVDPRNIGTVAALLRDLADRGMSVLITDHSAVDLLRLVDRAYVVEAGSVLAQGTPEDLVDNPDVQQAYLGGRVVL